MSLREEISAWWAEYRRVRELKRRLRWLRSMRLPAKPDNSVNRFPDWRKIGGV